MATLRKITLNWEIRTGAITCDTGYIKRQELCDVDLYVTVDGTPYALDTSWALNLSIKPALLGDNAALVAVTTWTASATTGLYQATAQTIGGTALDTYLAANNADTTDDEGNKLVDLDVYYTVSMAMKAKSDTVTVICKPDVGRADDTVPAAIIARNDFLVSNGTGLLVNVAAGYAANGAFVAAQSSVAITNATNYIEVSAAGVVSVNTTAFTAGSYPLATVVASAGAITSNTDLRAWITPKPATSTGLTVGTTAIASGTSGRILYDNAGVLGELPVGTGVATALAVNVGSAGAFITQSGGTAGNAASATLAATVTVANEATDTTCFPLFASSATGSLAALSNATLTYNCTDQILGSTRFAIPRAASAIPSVKRFFLTSGNADSNPTVNIESDDGAFGSSYIMFRAGSANSGYQTGYNIELDVTGARGVQCGGSLMLGTPGTVGGSLKINGLTSDSATISVSATGGLLALPSGTTATNMTLTTPDLGTPSVLVGTNITGTAAGLTAGTVTTNANLTGHVTSVGNAAVLGSFTMAQLSAAVSDGDPAYVGAANTFTAANAFAPTARTSGSASYLTITTPADTTLAASTESIGVNKTAATRQFATGALTTQREVVLDAPTYGFVGASTVTTAVNLDVKSPIAGTNATLTNRYAIRSEAMNVATAVGNSNADASVLFRIFAGKYSRTPISINEAGAISIDSTAGMDLQGGTLNFSGAAALSITPVAWKMAATNTGTYDTTISRNAAGIVQIGTNASNALGSLLLTNLTASGTLAVTGSQSRAAWTTTGTGLVQSAASYTDTSSSGTVAVTAINNLAQPTLLASSATTYTDSFVTRMAGPPVASTNVTQTRAHTLGILDSTTAYRDSTKGALVVATAFGTGATSCSIGNGTITAGSEISISPGGTLLATWTQNQFYNGGGSNMAHVAATFTFQNASNHVSFAIGAGASGYGYLTASSVSATACALTATGTDSNISINIVPKGTGVTNLNGTGAAVAGTLAVTGATTLTGLLTANGGITLGDAQDIAFNTTTGTKIGATTSQKLSFWNATPIVQPTTAVASATVASPGAGSNIKTDDTFDGYTIAQVVKALRNAGLLA